MKRNRVDSIAEQVKIIATGEIKPPAHVKLRKCDLPFWVAIIDARARTTWHDADLVHAVNLARCLADIETLTKEIEIEGFTVKNEQTGILKTNSKCQVTDMLFKRSITLSKMLHVHACAILGRSSDTGKRTQRERELLESQSGDDLLAKPIVQ